MNCGLGKSRILIGMLIVLLFMYAYRIYQKKKKFLDVDEDEDQETNEKQGVIDRVRGKKNEKIARKDTKENSEVDKEKIGKLVNEILSRQIPQ